MEIINDTSSISSYLKEGTMNNYLRRLSRLVLILVIGMIAMGNVVEMFAQNRVTFSLLNRRAVGTMYYAELWATVATNSTWIVGNSLINVHFNSAALSRPATNLTVFDADPEISGTISYSAHYQSNYGTGLSYNIILNPNPTRVTKTGTFKIGTFRFLINNPNAMDDLTFSVPPAGDRSDIYHDESDQLGYDCGNASCYGVVNPVSRLVGLPVITAEPTNQTTCSGQAVSFGVTVTGSSISYQWQYATTTNGTFTDVSGATSANLTISPATSGNVGAYRVVVTNTTGTVTSNVVTLVVNSTPVVTAQPTNQAGCVGGSATFTVSYTSSVPATIQWQVFNSLTAAYENIPGATSNTLTLSNLTTAQSESYRAQLTNGCGVTNSNPATLTVNSTPVVNNSPANQAGCVGSSVSFSANAASALGHTTQWEVSVNGGGQFAPIAGETSGTLTLTNIQVAESGNQYRAVFTNICGSTASGVAVLTVNTVPVVATQPSNVTACEAQTATFTASATGTPAPSVSWEVSTNTGATWSAIAGETSGTLTVSNVSAAQNGYQYRAVFSNTCGTVMSTVATLNVNTAPVVAVQPQAQTACENASVSFTATANSIPAPSVQWQVSVGTSGTWSNIQGAVSNTYTLNAVQFSQNGEQYRAVFTNVCGTTNSNAAVLTVNRAPQVATVAPSAQTICAGSQVTFTASSTGGSPASTIQWQSRPNSAGTFTNVSGATSASYSFTTTAANNGSEYRAIFTNICGSTTSNVAVLTVNNVATIINQPVNTAQCIGGTVTFTATATGTPAPTIQWQVSTNGGSNYTDLSNGGNISGAQTTTLTVSNIAVSQNNNLYRANFINTCGTVSSLGAVLTVNVAPVVTANPTSLEVCTNSSATFTAAATATPAANVQWQVSAGTSGTWTNIQGANGTSFTITSATLAESGNQYRAIFTNACGSSTSASATLTVSQGPTIAMNPVDNTVCEGTSVTFMSQATGVPAPTAQWEVRANSNAQWMPIAGANAPNYTIANPTFAMNGSQYRVVYTNACGMTPTSFAVLTVNTAPVVSTQPQDQTVCAGDNATFTVAATGSPVASIQWEVSTNGGANYTAIQGANSTTYTFTAGPNDDGNMYRARFTNICGDVTSTAAMLNFYALPQIVQQPTAVSVCQGESFTLTVGAVGTGLTYQWRKDGIDIPNSNSASYTVASASAANAGFYSVVVSNICNQPVVSNPISVVVNLTPVITVQPVPVTVCQGSFAQFFVQATGTGLSYQWRRNNTDIPGATNTFYNIPAATPADAGVYSVAITGACGTPVVSNNAQLTVETAPVVTTQPADITVCEGNSATFTVAASGSNLSYQWMFNGQNIANATGATLVLNSVTAASAGSYSVTITGSCPTPVTSRLAALTVNANPVIVSNVQDQVVCAGNAVTFNVGATGTGLTYQWYFNNSPITGAVGSSYTINPANFGNAGDYYVLISGACTTNNPVRSRTASLTVYENVVITRQPESAVVCVDGTVILSVGASGTGFPGDGLRYQWYKDGQLIPSATENQFVISNAQFFASGNYSVTVTGVCGTVVSNDAIVVVNRRASAVLNEPRNKRVAVGDDVVFEVSDVSGAGTTFQWYKDGEPLTDIPGKIVGSQSSKLYIYNVQQSDESNNYYVIVSGCGTATSELASLNLFNPNIQFTEQPVDVTACTNGTVTLTALATTNIENGTISYQWFRNGIAITGATQRTLTITSATIADAGTYRVEATETSKQLTVTSNNANVSITAAPVIAAQPVSIRECENSMVSLTVAVNPEAGNVSYQWFKDSAPIDPALNPTATTATLMGPVVALTVGSYTVVVTNDCGTTTSEPATVGMKEKTVITQQPQNVQLEVLGVSELRLTVTAIGENCSYQWKLNGNNIAGATSNEYVVTRPTTSDLGNYTVDIICECGTTTSSVAVVTGFTTDVDFPVAGEGFYLGQNYPNPFGGQTSIMYMTPTSTDVRISVTDMYGREVAVLVDGVVNAGTHTVKFDASQLPSGTYFYTMTASGFNTSRRMLLVK
jgi:hypothetical protein